ALDKWQN
nr:Chain C, gp41 MPER peptide [synthetic construct]